MSRIGRAFSRNVFRHLGVIQLRKCHGLTYALLNHLATVRLERLVASPSATIANAIMEEHSLLTGTQIHQFPCSSWPKHLPRLAFAPARSAGGFCKAKRVLGC